MLYCYFLILQFWFVCVLFSRFVMLYCYFIRYNVSLCLVMLLCNDATLFCRLQYCVISYPVTLQSHYIVLFLTMLFRNVIMMFSMFNIVLCFVPLVCIITMFCFLLCCFVLLHVFPNIALWCCIVMLQHYYIILYVSNLCRIILYCSFVCLFCVQ